ncbi:thioredoxin domain-containing protein [Wenzhouxiangella limi]|uniref:Thioredoxin domain-containing protein n=1 Tax=Wenzhouxiangella limi TaxID=2707351 RepID=A0A845UWU7_9GAMM|nr:thioredoxin domain-containing protein [Wenzhouxiangella limi]NDY95907.1 thioredoxin domain-containing protein [Wenzhouxiangella limi]
MDLRNQLDRALSPYLLQHADNPVHWLEWSRESLELARRTQRPILLSIGYSACHWCHVMAEESFADEPTAELMNEHFVNIKVDREERPDLDRIYQLAHQLLSGRGGGWPLTVFLDPDSQAPFFAGTYFPPEPRHGLIGFSDLLARIQEIWSTRRDELRAQHLQVQEALQAIASPHPDESGPAGAADDLIGQLAARFDAEHAGFGTSPKFPQAPVLMALESLIDHDDQAERMLADTLDAIARYGLRDHLGGGFFRYATDAAWEIPHFEKMLSDNALLLGLFARAARRWDHAGYRGLSEQTVNWLLREMRLDNGAFAASCDADSQDGEGAFYVWTPQQVRTLLPADQADIFCARFGLDGPPNFESRAWHPVISKDFDELTDGGRDRKAITALLDEALATLLAARNQRPAPPIDDKLVGSWNGLAIASLAEAGRLLGRKDWREQAARALDAVAISLFGHEPPRAVWRRGRSAQNASLDDHAAALLACLELLQWRFERRWFNLARRIARRIEQQFTDPESGAMYFTSVDHEPLLTRPLAYTDDATPAGAGLAIRGLLRLGDLTGEPTLLAAAERSLRAAAGDAKRTPLAYATLISAALETTQTRAQILLAGPAEQLAAMQRAADQYPAVACYRIPVLDPEDEPPTQLAELASAQSPLAILCRGRRCLAPIRNAAELATALRDEIP